MNGGRSEVWVRRRILATAAFSALLATGCSEFTTLAKPNFGFIRVTVVTTGGDFDLDGYAVALDAVETRALGSSPATASAPIIQSFYTSAGTHAVTLQNVADNCTVQGTNVQTVAVETGAITEVMFEVVCAATGITVTTRTTGVDTPNALSMTVSGRAAVTVPSNGSHTVGRFTAGSYTVTLSVPAHCTVTGGGQVVVTVAARTVTPVTFDVSCVPVARLEKIAYVDQGAPNGFGFGVVSLVSVDGAAPFGVGVGRSPAWSRNGTMLAFSTTSCSEDYYYAWVCTGGLMLLDPETKNEAAPTGGRAGFHPAWAPSGAAMAFDSYAGSDTSTRELRVLQLSPSSVVTLTIGGPRSKEQPTWSPDGQRIAFVCRWPVNTDLCIVNADGGGLIRLTDDAQADLRPTWSADGSRIAFTRHPAGRTDAGSGEIVLIDVATRQLTVLTKGTDPAWSRDGARLVFSGDNGIFVIGANGANLTRLTTGPHRAPAWRP